MNYLVKDESITKFTGGGGGGGGIGNSYCFNIESGCLNPNSDLNLIERTNSLPLSVK